MIQTTSDDNKAANLDRAERLVRAAVAATRPDLIVLPELFAYLGGTPAGALAAAEAFPDGQAYAMLSGLARELGVNIHGGSIGERNGDTLRNTSLVFDRSGAEIGRYAKIHMFDVVTPDGLAYRESATFTRGERTMLCEVDGVRLGASICYDLRFGELFIALAKAGAQMVAVPAAFTLATGKDHWEVLLRARAIETQCYILAAGQTGTYVADGLVRANYGNSMIVDPWGTVIARAPDKLGWTSAAIDLDYLDKVRAAVPSNQNRVLTSFG
ncbi:carbon-nitrogen hydrolase family protein [Sphingomonas sp. MG17]|uniref:Carbon-nitrogen hydrolase family protein n=1 Tax=Sphingomonas tagetis TaxID=2949092 RepID=A0A9X2HPC9_9SPHN|nr:carbon-nitrogen hydrolase family protein [Sphingomonas tagetis]